VDAGDLPEGMLGRERATELLHVPGEVEPALACELLVQRLVPPEKAHYGTACSAVIRTYGQGIARDADLRGHAGFAGVADSLPCVRLN
jgi:hypothetical protein